MHWVLRIILTPKCWERNLETSIEWDKILNDILDKYSNNFRISSNKMLMEIGEYSIWIGNYPYSFGYLYRPTKVDLLPTRKTCFRLKDIIDASIYDCQEREDLSIFDKIQKDLLSNEL